MNYTLTTDLAKQTLTTGTLVCTIDTPSNETTTVYYTFGRGWMDNNLKPINDPKQFVHYTQREYLF